MNSFMILVWILGANKTIFICVNKPPMLFQYLMVGAFIAYLRMLWEDPDSILHHFIEDKEDEK